MSCKSAVWAVTIAVLISLILFAGKLLFSLHPETNSFVAHFYFHNDATKKLETWKLGSTYQLEALFHEYQSEILYSLKRNVLYFRGKLFSIVSNSLYDKSFLIKEIDLCRVSNLLNVFEVANNDRIDVSPLSFNSSAFPQSFQLPINPPVLSVTRSSGEVLIIIHTHDELSTTILSLQYLRNNGEIAAILIVDDGSIDGTVEYLQKKGFAVIAKPFPKGKLDSWNVGFRFALGSGYKHVIFTGAEVLLTAGAIHLMHYALASHPLVVPLTTTTAAGPFVKQVRSVSINDID
jgi:hypothetical protein